MLEKAFFGWFFIYMRWNFIMSFLIKLMKIQNISPNKVCLRMG